MLPAPAGPDIDAGAAVRSTSRSAVIDLLAAAALWGGMYVVSVGTFEANPPLTLGVLRLPSAGPVEALERAIERMEKDLPPLEGFILPGGHPSAAWAHMARTVARRAERRDDLVDRQRRAVGRRPLGVDRRAGRRPVVVDVRRVVEVEREALDGDAGTPVRLPEADDDVGVGRTDGRP